MEALGISLGVLFVLFLIHLFLLTTRLRRPAAADLVKVPYAHRGLHGEGVPENSLPAFRAAVLSGVGIELDVQLTADGEVVVFHEESLLRMTGEEGSLFSRTYEELSALRLGESEERIPTLREVLDLVAGRVPILVEIKPDHAVTSLCKKTAALLDGYAGDYMIESFHPLAVHWFRRHRPQVIRGQLSGRLFEKGKRKPVHFLLQNLLFNFIALPDFIAFDYRHKFRYSYSLCVLFHRPYTLAWTVTDKEALHASRGFDGVIYESLSLSELRAAERLPEDGEEKGAAS